MRKRLLCGIILINIIIIALAGCKKASSNNLYNKYGFQPPIKELYWGMTISEIEAGLSIKNGVDNIVYNYEKPQTTIILPTRLNKFGYDATVHLEVHDSIDEEWFPFHSSFLNEVKLIYTNIDTEKLTDNIIKETKDSGNEWINAAGNTCITWKSKDKISDLDKAIFKNLQDYWMILEEHANDYSISKEITQEDRINIITLMLGESDSALLIYKGDIVVPINKVCIK